ncbi:MAG TPA: PH domain-containing protein [Acidimicrobiales bacterium]|nr:PH domain-containing protein [Acidimicrobiales bacterium]
MTFPKRLVHDNEDVLLDARPHWWRLVGPAFIAVITVGACATVFIIWSGAPKWSGWALFGIGAVAVCYFLSRYVQWRSTDLVVTSLRVIYRSGVVSRSSRETPISSVQDVSIVQSLGERVLRKGRLSVQSAGFQGEAPFFDVRRPAVVQGLINQTIEKSRQRETDRVAEANRISVSEELERLAVLHRRGVITDAEFARLKGELIGGPDDQDS